MENKDKLPINEPITIWDKEQRGHLKIFIGYAPGVGKTYTMLTEGNRRKKYGQDVVIGYVESHNRTETDDQIGDLEIIPLKKVLYNKTEMDEMDTESIIAKKPQVVLIDELAHTNAPGSKNKKRYMDVEEILNQGINVITTLNIQHLESLNDVVYQITGIKVKETIPDYIVDKADEIVVVDLTPDALQNRLNRGKIYDPEKVTHALKNFFRKVNLNALRELTLRQTAEEVDEELSEYMKKEGIRDNWHTAERITVCISAGPSSKKLIRRGARIAKRYKCEWYVITVTCTNRFAKKQSLKDRQLLHTHFQLAKQLGAEVATLEGKSVTEEIVKWCNEKHITQIFIGYPRRTLFELIFRGSTVSKLIKKLNNVDIHLIANEVK
ncbi:MAG TPA: universal stress protein [Pseudobacteroides sp.]|uniref:sensor protein KdpD n=1 Tax=Pseudobacteroides sp. TaxID=1968840 RepID=UPI002F94485F